MTFAARLNQIEAKLIALERKSSLPLRNRITSAATMVAICKAVRRRYDMPNNWLTTHRRRERQSWPRQIAMFLIREFTDETFDSIGLCLGGRTRGAILYGAKHVKCRMDTDQKVREEIESWRRVLQQLKKETEL